MISSNLHFISCKNPWGKILRIRMKWVKGKYRRITQIKIMLLCPQITKNCCKVFNSMMQSVSWGLHGACLGLLTFRFTLCFSLPWSLFQEALFLRPLQVWPVGYSGTKPGRSQDVLVSLLLLAFWCLFYGFWSNSWKTPLFMVPLERPAAILLLPVTTAPGSADAASSPRASSLCSSGSGAVTAS